MDEKQNTSRLELSWRFSFRQNMDEMEAITRNYWHFIK
uniref:Uncharacterized protein n=1 Tax=Anguilla anguilla TaxID=7936 RepID=A0A0E9T1Q0_ANGAN